MGPITAFRMIFKTSNFEHEEIILPLIERISSPIDNRPSFSACPPKVIFLSFI